MFGLSPRVRASIFANSIGLRSEMSFCRVEVMAIDDPIAAQTTNVVMIDFS